MANRTVVLYIRGKDGYRTAPKRLTDLPPNETYYLFWYEGKKKKAKSAGRYADAAEVARINMEHSLRLAGVGNRTATVTASVPEPQPETETPKSTSGVKFVRAAVKEYLEDIHNRVGSSGYGCSPRTEAAYRKRLGYLLEFDGTTPLAEVDKAYMKRFLTFLTKRVENDRYRYNIMQAVSIFFRTLGNETAREVLKGMGFEPLVVKAYSADELNKFFAACTPDEELVYRFFLYSMGREGEVAHTEVADLLFDESVLFIQPKPWRKFKLKGKKGNAAKGRKVPMPREFMDRLKTYVEGKQEHDLLFPNTEGRVEGHFLKKCQQIAKRAGMDKKNFGLHKFRKTGATTMYKKGISVPAISCYLGHTKLEITQAYLDIRDAASMHMVDEVSKVWAA